jgi:hypothetical protein
MVIYENQFDVLGRIDGMLQKKLSKEEKKQAQDTIARMSKEEYAVFYKAMNERLMRYSSAKDTLLKLVYSTNLETKEKILITIQPGNSFAFSKKDAGRFTALFKFALKESRSYIREKKLPPRRVITRESFTSHYMLCVLNNVGMQYVREAVALLANEEISFNANGNAYSDIVGNVLGNPNSRSYNGVILKNVLYALLNVLRYQEVDGYSEQFLEGKGYAGNLRGFAREVENMSEDDVMTLFDEIERTFVPKELPATDELTNTFGRLASDISAQIKPNGGLTKYYNPQENRTIFQILEQATAEGSKIKNRAKEAYNKSEKARYQAEEARYDNDPSMPEPRPFKEKEMSTPFNPNAITNSDVFYLINMICYNTTQLTKYDRANRASYASEFMPADRFDAAAQELEAINPNGEGRNDLSRMQNVILESAAAEALLEKYKDYRKNFAAENKYKPNVHSMVKRRVDKITNSRKRSQKKQEAMTSRLRETPRST